MSDAPPPPPPPPPPPGGTPPPPPPPDGLSPPPGYVPYGTAPTPLTRVYRVRAISRAVAILAGVAGVASAIGGVIAPSVSESADDFLQGRISEDDFIASYGPLALTQLLTLAATLAACIVTMIWMFRISKNVRAYGRPTFWAPLFAIFGWLLPPILFVIPFLMLRELWKASTPEGISDPEGWKRQPENPMLWAWWTFFGIIPVVFAVIQFDTLFGGGVSGGDTESVAENLQDAGGLSLASGLVQLVAAILWILFVRQLTGRHATLTNES